MNNYQWSWNSRFWFSYIIKFVKGEYPKNKAKKSGKSLTSHEIWCETLNFSPLESPIFYYNLNNYTFFINKYNCGIMATLSVYKANIHSLEKDFFMMKKWQRFNTIQIQQRIAKIPAFINFIEESMKKVVFYRRKINFPDKVYHFERFQQSNLNRYSSKSP